MSDAQGGPGPAGSEETVPLARSPSSEHHHVKAAWIKRLKSSLVDRRHTFVEDTHLTIGKKLSYAAPQFSLTSLTMLIGIHGTIFYTKLGANVAFIAFFTALARSFDVVTDPLMGWISDKTRTAQGRRRPYMLAGCWGYALCFICLFNPPSAVTGVQISLWFGFFYVVFYLFDTMSNVPYGALGPEMSDDANERNSLFFWAKMVNGVGILFGAVGPVGLTILMKNRLPSCTCDEQCPAGYAASMSLPGSAPWNATLYGNFSADMYVLRQCANQSIAAALPEMMNWCGCREACDTVCDIAASRRAFFVTALGFGLFYCGAMVNCVVQIKERAASMLKKSPPLIPSLLATLRNKPFMGLLPAWVCDMTAYTMIGTMLPFYMEYIIIPSSTPECADGKRALLGFDSPGAREDEMWCKTETWLGVGLVCLITAQIVSMPAWLAITKRLGKFKTWLLFNLVTAVTNGLFVFIGAGDPKACMLLAFLNGLPSGAQFLTDSIVADVIDYDEFLTGKRSEGRFTIFQTFIPKIVSIPSQAIPLALLSAFGFRAPVDGRTQAQPEAVKWFIKVVFFVLPCMLAVASFFIKTRFPIRDEAISRQIVSGAALHMAGHPAKDPLTGKTLSLFAFGAEGEEADSHRLDTFFRGCVGHIADGNPHHVIHRMRNNVLMGLVTAGLFFVIMVFSITPMSCDEAGVCVAWIQMPSVSWVPAFSVIITGMSVSSIGFNLMRLRVARSLLKEPIEDDFVQRWVQYLDGSDDVANAIVGGEELQQVMAEANEEHRAEHERRNSVAATGAGAAAAAAAAEAGGDPEAPAGGGEGGAGSGGREGKHSHSRVKPQAVRKTHVNDGLVDAEDLSWSGGRGGGAAVAPAAGQGGVEMTSLAGAGDFGDGSGGYAGDYGSGYAEDYYGELGSGGGAVEGKLESTIEVRVDSGERGQSGRSHKRKEKTSSRRRSKMKKQGSNAAAGQPSSHRHKNKKHHKHAARAHTEPPVGGAPVGSNADSQE